MAHLMSFLKSPLGYILNLMATITCYIPTPNFVEKLIADGCEVFCITDGIQDDMMF